MRTIATSSPSVRWYAIVNDSENRFASSYTLRTPIGLTWPQYDSGCGWTSGSPYTSLVDARKNRAPLTRANSRRFLVPVLPTASVSSGIAR